MIILQADTLQAQYKKLAILGGSIDTYPNLQVSTVSILGIDLFPTPSFNLFLPSVSRSDSVNLVS